MKISTKGKYGLMALLDLTVYGDGTHMNIKTIAERQGISDKYLEQIFATLTKAGILRSMRGAQGGYYLADTPDKITVRQILTALEGPLSPVACVADGRHKDCDRYDVCVTRKFWRDMMYELNRVTEAVSLADLAKCHEMESRGNNLDYSI
jgi:Rrf2 family transcriptional regulator, cysteine metabolism repressor